jgi:hypothetical protein
MTQRSLFHVWRTSSPMTILYAQRRPLSRAGRFETSERDTRATASPSSCRLNRTQQRLQPYPVPGFTALA